MSNFSMIGNVTNTLGTEVFGSPYLTGLFILFMVLILLALFRSGYIVMLMITIPLIVGLATAGTFAQLPSYFMVIGFILLGGGLAAVMVKVIQG